MNNTLKTLTAIILTLALLSAFVLSAAEKDVSQEITIKEAIGQLVQKDPAGDTKKEPAQEPPAQEPPVTGAGVAPAPVTPPPAGQELPATGEEPTDNAAIKDESGNKDPINEEEINKDPINDEPSTDEVIPEDPITDEEITDDPANEEEINNDPTGDEEITDEVIPEDPTTEEGETPADVIDPTLYQVDENGELILDENGMPIPLLPEDAELLLETVDEAAPQRRIEIYAVHSGGWLTVGDTVTLVAVLYGYEGLTYSLQWQVNRGSGWSDLSGATSNRTSFSINEKNYRYHYRIVVNVAEAAT